MDTSLVSVIIPVYNTEIYVEEAVRSIIDQTLRNIEIIIVDDGSTDNSFALISQLAKEDSRIQIYFQENQGQSVARNSGMKHVNGKYIYFMDSDDYLEPNALESCCIRCEQQNLDFISFEGEILNKSSRYDHLDLNYKIDKNIQQDIIYKGIYLFEYLIKNKSYSPSPCLIFVRNEYLQRLNLSFYDNIIHEDQLFTTLVYLQAERVSCIHQTFFKRRLRENSTMTQSFSMRNMNSYFTIIDQLVTFSNTHPETKQIIKVYLSQMLNAAVWLSHKMLLFERTHIAVVCCKKYKKYVSIKNILILLFKEIIKR